MVLELMSCIYLVQYSLYCTLSGLKQTSWAAVQSQRGCNVQPDRQSELFHTGCSSQLSVMNHTFDHLQTDDAAIGQVVTRH